MAIIRGGRPQTRDRGTKTRLRIDEELARSNHRLCFLEPCNDLSLAVHLSPDGDFHDIEATPVSGNDDDVSFARHDDRLTRHGELWRGVIGREVQRHEHPR